VILRLLLHNPLNLKIFHSQIDKKWLDFVQILVKMKNKNIPIKSTKTVLIGINHIQILLFLAQNFPIQNPGKGSS